MKDCLIFELSKLCLGNLGLTVNSKVGLSDESLIVDSLSIDDEGTIYSVNIFSGQIQIGSNKIRTIGLKLPNKNNFDIIGLFQIDDMKTYGIRSDFINPSVSLFLSFDSIKDNLWKPVSKYDMLITSAGLEKLMSAGYVWTKCNDFSDLKQKISTLIEL